MKEFIKTTKAPGAVGPYSQGIIAGGFAFVAGQLPINPETGELYVEDISLQTRQVIENMKAILEEKGYSLDDVVSVQVFMKDLSKFGEMNKVYEEYFKDSLPARAAIEVSNLPKGADIEMTSIAYKE